MKKKAKVYSILAAFFGIAFLTISIIYGYSKFHAYQVEKQLNSMAEENELDGDSALVQSDHEEAESGNPNEDNQDETITEQINVDIPQKDINWDELRGIIPDIYAWLYIPNANVDYPVLQHPSDDAYYLKHNIDGSSGLPGCLYTELFNNKSFSDFNTVIYGHNMRNGSMFGSLDMFCDRQFFDQNRYIFVYLPDDKVLVHDIFAAYTWSDQHILKAHDFTDAEIRKAYLNDVFQNSRTSSFRTGVDVSEDSKLLTLSTCISTSPKERFIVQGVLIND